MKQDFFKYLPPEITINILSRLPLRPTAVSKCVCKSWLELLESREFVKSHLSRFSPALAVLVPEGYSNWLTVFEFEDELDLESHDHHYNHLTKFDFPHRVAIEGSSNGLLFLRKKLINSDDLYVCNPFTREYIKLHFHEGPTYSYPRIACGFGVSKITTQHKLVCIVPETACHVYTLGSGSSWRRLEVASVSFDYGFCMLAAFVNGNLHWIVSDSDGTRWISCLDLETECFTTFSVPPFRVEYSSYIQSLSCLKDSLCLSNYMKQDGVVIWLMKEYGVEKSWTREYVVSTNKDFDRYNLCSVYPIKVFEGGDILMVWDDRLLFYYSNKTKTSQEICMFGDEDDCVSTMLLTPSFLSLKSFGVEHVISF